MLCLCNVLHKQPALCFLFTQLLCNWAVVRFLLTGSLSVEIISENVIKMVTLAFWLLITVLIYFHVCSMNQRVIQVCVDNSVRSLSLVLTSLSLNCLYRILPNSSLFPYVSLGDPVCTERLHPILVLHPEWRWVLLTRDQTDAAKCPCPVLHTVTHTHTHTQTHYMSNIFSKKSSNLYFVYICMQRSKEVDWQPYFTTRLVDDFATHLRVFRKAQDRLGDREDKLSTCIHHTPCTY